MRSSVMLKIGITAPVACPLHYHIVKETKTLVVETLIAHVKAVANVWMRKPSIGSRTTVLNLTCGWKLGDGLTKVN